ncbi:MAG TPA: CAP domain-containing protein [Candidatus Binataceae bacterium]|nr:CAP domain-containing protein [Candidatus Binataceae bacterium]
MALTGCAAEQEVLQSEPPSFYISMAAARAEVDAKAAASMISGFRRNNGLGPVTIDKELMRLAREHANEMAARNEMGHNVGRRFEDRIANSTVRARAVAENVGAGYHTLAEAFSGWRDSPGHRANMLHPDVTRIGIAAAYAPGSKYKVFWALILASPNERRNDEQNPGLWPFFGRPPT